MGERGHKARILVSRCLLGELVRYDGGSSPLRDPRLSRWQAEGRLVELCPELLGGLAVPRPPVELSGGRARTREGDDVTDAFERGADRAVALASATGAALALLKQRSPSCGSRWIHDGSFAGRLVEGEGITARRLRERGIRVFDEGSLGELERAVEELDDERAPPRRPGR